MHYESFRINKYRAIKDLEIKLDSKLVPIIGINECGKTTILQAIYAFDYLNDSENDSRHITNIRNLYDTQDHDSTIIAKIRIKNKELIEVFETLQDDVFHGETELLGTEAPFNCNLEKIKTELTPANNDVVIEITRNITKKTYTTDWNCADVLNSDTIKKEFCQIIVSSLPYILYNDDFADRPPSEVIIPLPKPKVLTGWLAIYERLFNITNASYSLFTLISETDNRRKESVISDVEKTLNKTLSEAWKSFTSDKAVSINVSLNIKEAAIKTLQISIIEKMNGKNRYFDVLDRSKGFVWYYNFIMKIQFNPKVAGRIEDTLFLLDEPGSYLHATAQEKLCKNLSEISKQFGIVVYCTHSHHLLNPNQIPLKNVIIVEKNKTKTISAIPLPVFKTKSDKNNAMQPIYEALQVPVYELFSDESELLLVEGINDKHIIEMFTTVPDMVKILPGTSADSIVKSIQYMIAYNKKFKALWDNDKEGNLCRKRAEKFFHLDDDVLKVLPLEGKVERRMEDMLTLDDLMMISDLLGMISGANYDLIIPALYYSSQAIKEEAKRKISDCAKKLFLILEKILYEKVNSV